MKFRVQYLADDGEVRWMTVEAKDEDDAKHRAIMEDMGNSGGDSISKILTVEQA